MRRYLRFVVPAGIVVVALIGLSLMLSRNLVYFRTPTELVEEVDAGSDRLRLGGQVVAGTVADTDGGVSFEVTDGRYAVAVAHRGAPQQLFREGAGVVVEGAWDGAVFHSDTMLVKHDEQYRTGDGEVYREGESPGDES